MSGVCGKRSHIKIVPSILQKQLQLRLARKTKRRGILPACGHYCTSKSNAKYQTKYQRKVYRCMSLFKFKDSDFEKMSALYKSLSPNAVKRIQNDAMEAPKPLPPIQPEAHWLANVCVHRASFANTVFATDTNPTDAFAFLYASMNPKWAVFLKVARTSVLIPDLGTLSIDDAFNLAGVPRLRWPKNGVDCVVDAERKHMLN